MRALLVLALFAAGPAAAQLDPGALPLAPGTWTFHGADGAPSYVVVTEAESGCVDARWQSRLGADAVPGPRERWCATEAGVVVAGRGLGNRWRDLDRPYLVVPYHAVEGHGWEAAVSAGPRGTVRGAVGPVEVVETPAGRFRARRIEAVASRTRVRRWYAPGVGLVREEQALLGDGGAWTVYRDERLAVRP